MQVGSRAMFLLVGLLAWSAGPIAFAETEAFAETDTSRTAEDARLQGKRVLGWVENMRLLPDYSVMKAKLDPGAKSSAIHAEDIEEFEQDGRRMVRFALLNNHSDPRSGRLVMERPLVREVNIKLRNTERRDQRPVVRLEFCLAGEIHNGLFSLTNRSNFNYPILLGRSFLSDRILVDSGESFTQKTRCPRS